VRVALLLATITAAGVFAQRQEPFPHRAHARLFPLCDACHEGIISGTPSNYYPSPAQCASCHDGEREDRVAWSGPRPRVSNLDFAHTAHVRAAGDSVRCASCHATPEGTRMAVGAATPESCLRCHAHQATEHLAPGRDCAVCHQPLTATRLDTARIAQFPQPSSHMVSAFLLEHAPRTPADAAACATCHARESCTRCHFDARPPAIAQLAQDPRIALLQHGRAPEYPEPESHRPATWAGRHAAAASAEGASCGNCHAQRSCEACHRERLPAAAAALPQTDAADPRGVIVPVAAVRVHRANFVRGHATDAAVAESSCEGCHTSSYCESCHVATSSPGFHAQNFMARHAAESYAAESDCASCHNPDVFCRSCHASAGMASKGRLGVAFHTANAFWLVGHGVAARQGLESCATCHAQSSCTQCHSALGSWRVNPHGPRFNAARVESANRLTCRLCHLAGTSP
jgi:hypothetical protein